MAEEKDKRILCVGMICLDIVTVSEKYPEEDTDQRSLDYFWRRGGNASNSCTVLSLLGENAEVLGTLGKDQKAELEFLLSDLDQYGIKTQNCPLRGAPYRCPTAIIILSKQTGSRTILAALKSGQFGVGPGRKTKSLDFSCKGSFANLSRKLTFHEQGRRNGDVIGKMMDKVIAYNSTVSGSGKITVSLELEKRNRPILGPLIEKADYVFMSKDVAREKGYDSKEKAVAGLSESCKQGASVICAWGEDGAAGITKGGFVVSSKAFPPDSLIDTLGAGDTFNAATILALCEGKTLQEAVTFGCRVAGVKCGIMGFKELKGMQKFL